MVTQLIMSQTTITATQCGHPGQKQDKRSRKGRKTEKTRKDRGVKITVARVENVGKEQMPV